MPAQSQQQQKLFGLALAVKRGEVPASEVSDEVKDIVDRMSEKDIEDFASTSHKGLPKKVEAQIREMVREIMRERVIAEMSEEPIEEGKKVFTVNPGIGKVKYSISSHDGVKKHKDGSDFYDIKTFKNKVDLEKAIKDYTSKGFKMESVNEVASRTAMEIGALTGLNKNAVQDFVDKHDLDIEKLYKGVKSMNLAGRMNLVTAIAGKPGNSLQKLTIKLNKKNESVNEVDTKKADMIRKSMPGFVGPEFAKKASDEDILAMVDLKDQHAKIYNTYMKSINDKISKLQKKYRIKEK